MKAFRGRVESGNGHRLRKRGDRHSHGDARKKGLLGDFFVGIKRNALLTTSTRKPRQKIVKEQGRLGEVGVLEECGKCPVTFAEIKKTFLCSREGN